MKAATWKMAVETMHLCEVNHRVVKKTESSKAYRLTENDFLNIFYNFNTNLMPTMIHTMATEALKVLLLCLLTTGRPIGSGLPTGVDE